MITISTRMAKRVKPFAACFQDEFSNLNMNKSFYILFTAKFVKHIHKHLIFFFLVITYITDLYLDVKSVSLDRTAEINKCIPNNHRAI